MRQNFIKSLSLIFSLCLFASCFSMMPLASDIKTGYMYGGEYEAFEFSPNAERPIFNEANAFRFFGADDPDTPYMFYSQLTARQKEIYNQLKNAGTKTESVEVRVSDPYIGTGPTQNDAAVAVQPELKNDIIAAVTALVEDYPMLFWYKGFSFAYSYYPGTLDSDYTATVFSITLKITIDTSSYADYAEIEQKYGELKAAVENFEVAGARRYEKVKSIHDQLCRIIVYTSGVPMAHQPTGALLNGQSVCEGYAESFKLICDRENIPCITVLGTGNGGAHKWNYVKMDDGNWYLLDATWDDYKLRIYYDYMLIGYDSKASHSSNSSAPDSSVHIPDGKMFNNSFSLIYPTLSKYSYSYVMPAVDAGDISFDNTNSVLYVGKNITNYLSLFNTYLSDVTFTKSGSGTTGTVLKLNHSDGVSKTYLAVMRGDADASNTVTVNDYNKVVNAAFLKDDIQKGTAQYYAADMNGDGAVDAFDAMALDLYINGLIDY